MENHLFFGLPVYERKLPRKIGKQKVQVQSRYFYLAFERIFSDSPCRRLARHKMTTFDAYVEKVKKNKKKKLASDYTNALLRIALIKSASANIRFILFGFQWRFCV